MFVWTHLKVNKFRVKTLNNVQNENVISEIIYSHYAPACQIRKLDENWRFLQH